MRNTSPSSPLKWIGGKQRLLPDLIPIFPTATRLVEPFVGAGSVFAALTYPRLLLADNNPNLINLYRELQAHPEALIAKTCELFTEQYKAAEVYAELRRRYNREGLEPQERAALLIYLNRFGFNGLYRVNRAGEYNVPYGHHQKLPAFPGEAMLRYSARLQGAELVCADFEHVMERAVPGDVVYCDPPYADLENRASFTGYGSSGFAWEDQVRLVEKAIELSSRGVPVLISNHDTQATRRLYRDAEIYSFSVRRSVAASQSARGDVHELVAVFTPASSGAEGAFSEVVGSAAGCGRVHPDGPGGWQVHQIREEMGVPCG